MNESFLEEMQRLRRDMPAGAAFWALSAAIAIYIGQGEDDVRQCLRFMTRHDTQPSESATKYMTEGGES